MSDGGLDRFIGNDKLNRIVLSAENPFSSSVVQSAWDEIFDVPSINKTPFEGIMKIVKVVQKDQKRKAKIGLLLGDVGLGKTHLLSRIRKSANENNFYFIQIEPVPDIDKIHMHILREVLSNLGKIETGEKYSFLELMIANIVSQKFCLALKRIGGSKKLISRLEKKPLSIFELNFTTEQRTKLYNNVLRQLFREKPNIDVNLLQVLFRLTDPNLYYLAIKWLQCENLTEEELKVLGVGTALNDEMRASGALKSIFQISDRVLLLGFDQIEGIIQRFGIDGIRTFLQTIAMLYNGYPNHISLLSCQSQVWLETVVRNLDQSLTDRISKKFDLENLNEDDIVSLVKLRMDQIWKNTKVIPSSEIFPFSQEYLVDLGSISGWNPRNILNRLRDTFDQIQESGVIEIPKPTVPSIEEKGVILETLDDYLLTKFKEIEESNYPTYINSPASKQEDLIKAALYDLLKLQQTFPQSGISIESIIMNFAPIKTRKPIDLVSTIKYDSEVRKIGINFHFSNHMGSLYWSLNRLNKYRNDGHIDLTFIIRGDSGISTTASKTQEELTEILKTGLLMNVNNQEGARFYAVKRLIDSISAQELSYGNKPVSIEEASAFIFQHASGHILTFQGLFNFLIEKLGVQIQEETKPTAEEERVVTHAPDEIDHSELIEETLDILKERKVTTLEELYSSLTRATVEESIYKGVILKDLEAQGWLLIREDDENTIIMADESLLKS